MIDILLYIFCSKYKNQKEECLEVALEFCRLKYDLCGGRWLYRASECDKTMYEDLIFYAHILPKIKPFSFYTKFICFKKLINAKEYISFRIKELEEPHEVQNVCCIL